jgi:O-antigen ligase
VAATHLFALGTGWRPPNPTHSFEAGRDVFYGGVFVNPNTLGAFYAMTIPVALLQLLRGVLRPGRQLLLIGALVLMGSSLVLTGSRGGILFTAVMSSVVLVISRPSLSRALAISVLALGVFAAVLGFMSLLLPEFLNETLRVFFIERLSTRRFELWGKCVEMLFDNPFGVGLSSANFLSVSGRYGIPFATAHNIYLDHAVYAGFLGLIGFLGLVTPIVTRGLRVLRTKTDPQDMVVHGCLFAVVLAFLLGGLVEPIYHNSYRLSQVFWLFAGLSTAASSRALVKPAAARPDDAISSGWQAQSGTGFGDQVDREVSE